MNKLKQQDPEKYRDEHSIGQGLFHFNEERQEINSLFGKQETLLIIHYISHLKINLIIFY
jgi:hypothetical protein